VLAAGGVYSAASSAFTPTELARQVKDGASNLIICSKDVIGVAKEAAKLCNVPMERVVVLESDPIWRMWKVTDDEENLVGWQKLDWERVTDKQVLETRPITLLYSSGTTGVPKGVPLTSWNMVSEAYIPAVMLRQHLAHLEDLGHPSFEYRTLAHLPAAHVAGVQGYFVNPFCNGGLTVWTPRFDFALFLHYNRTFRITFFFTVPPIYLLIAKSPLVTDQFQNVRWAFSGAAPMGPELQRAASAKLSMGHDVWVAQTWGLSETTGSVTIQPWGERDETGSVSPIMPNCEVRVVDDEGMDVPAGKEGEILMKGPVVFKGYHKNVTVTQESFKDGWFCTGDVGLVKDSKVYIVDRKKVCEPISHPEGYQTHADTNRNSSSTRACR
jgi:4-coumarate--CoA ligase